LGEKPADLLISVIPHFNRQICESWTKVYPGRPFVTIITTWLIFRRDSGLSQSKISTLSRARKKPPIKRVRWGMTTLIFSDVGNDLATGFLRGR